MLWMVKKWENVTQNKIVGMLSFSASKKANVFVHPQSFWEIFHLISFLFWRTISVATSRRLMLFSLKLGQGIQEWTK